MQKEYFPWDFLVAFKPNLDESGFYHVVSAREIHEGDFRVVVFKYIKFSRKEHSSSFLRLYALPFPLKGHNPSYINLT